MIEALNHFVSPALVGLLFVLIVILLEKQLK